MIIIVAGPPCAGKSTFIKKHFPNHTVIAIDDFQKGILGTVDDVMQSYYNCRDALMKAIQSHDNVVLEHTLLKRERREMYINAIREVTNDDISMFFIFPDRAEHLRRAQKRDPKIPSGSILAHRDIVEIPTPDEGYKHAYIIKE